VDKGSAAVRIIKENLDNCGLKNKAEVLAVDVFKALQYFQRQEVKFNLIYVDPPFTNERIFDDFIAAIDQIAILEQEGILSIRTRRQKNMPDDLSTLEKYRCNHLESLPYIIIACMRRSRRHDGNFSHT
jgi:16S rRNA G966 N2-methylase RsmD